MLKAFQCLDAFVVSVSFLMKIHKSFFKNESNSVRKSAKDV